MALKLRRKKRLPAIDGSVPDLLRLPPGCAFHPRCPDVMPECRERTPRFLPLGTAAGTPDAAPGAAGAVACFKHHDPQGQPR